MRTLVLLLLLVPFAAADSAFHFKQGTISATPAFDVIGNTQSSFSGHNLSLTGFGTVDGSCGFCLEGAGGSWTLTPTFRTGVDQGSTLVINGQTFKDAILGSGVVAMGNPFVLPAPSGVDGSIFSVTLPVTFSGFFVSQQGSFTFPAHGTATITFSEFDSVWSWQSATFTLVPVPEPSTIGLLATGLVAMGARIRRQRGLGKMQS